jgi:hypothetical protein
MFRVTLKCCKETQYHNKLMEPEDEVLLDTVPFEHLSIQRCSKTCPQNIVPWAKMHALHSLEYISYYDWDSGIFFQPLLVACSHSLTDLHIHISDCTSSIAKLFTPKP